MTWESREQVNTSCDWTCMRPGCPQRTKEPPKPEPKPNPKPKPDPKPRKR